MKGLERRKCIKQLIKQDLQASVEALSHQFKVTGETIRRDLDKLQEEGCITRTHGGAVWNEAPGRAQAHFYTRQQEQPEAKQRIAQLVFPLIQSRRTVVADSSTTVLEALRTLSGQKDLLVLTNSTAICHELADAEFTLLSSGGFFNPRSLSYQGALAIENLKRYNVELALIGCKGLLLDQGILDSNEAEAEIKKVMLAHAQEVILLADHTKFNQSAFVHLIDPERVHCIVTDQKPDVAWVSYCATRNIQLIYA